MEEAKGVLKHTVLLKFKDGTPLDQIDQLIKGCVNLSNLIPTVKAFHWGKDVRVENPHQDFTHLFEYTFESAEGLAEYMAHPAHVELATVIQPYWEKLTVFNYRPSTVHSETKE
ncbi:hypothetical protein L1049_017548 [Liquidambar formosana]|uniref:Stress-response A/B barrel domain-containing protein n=1 Tax=Liquidambar formosana TaxID=63359 RepID=A0AAP0S221_LIQFO